MASILPPTEGVTTPPRKGLHDYGFTWGPLDVTRIMIGRRGRRTNYVLGVVTQHHRLEISVSKTGRSVRVWLDGEELA